MNMTRRLAYPGILLTLLLVAGCTMPPERNTGHVSFRKQVYPILATRCQGCHLPPDGIGYHKTGLSLRTYADLMHGTRFGPVIVPGDSLHSILCMLVEGRTDPSLSMPHDGIPLTGAEVDTLSNWVAQGARDN